MGKKTALYETHLALNARMVDFAGFDMPLHYGSQVNEHLSVRQHAGVFDVSHINIVDIEGEKAKDFSECFVQVRDKLHSVKLTQPVFVRKGKAV